MREPPLHPQDLVASSSKLANFCSEWPLELVKSSPGRIEKHLITCEHWLPGEFIRNLRMTSLLRQVSIFGFSNGQYHYKTSRNFCWFRRKCSKMQIAKYLALALCLLAALPSITAYTDVVSILLEDLRPRHILSPCADSADPLCDFVQDLLSPLAAPSVKEAGKVADSHNETQPAPSCDKGFMLKQCRTTKRYGH